jgi:pantetheine-phosphate adenylyltransferase
MRIGVYPGTFDPVTYGHLDLVERGRKHVDRLILAVLRNEDKEPLFSEDRITLLRDAVARFDNVVVDSFDGLLVDRYARSTNATLILRGLRGVRLRVRAADGDDERRLAPDLETAFLMPSAKRFRTCPAASSARVAAWAATSGASCPRKSRGRSRSSGAVPALRPSPPASSRSRSSRCSRPPEPGSLSVVSSRSTPREPTGSARLRRHGGSHAGAGRPRARGRRRAEAVSQVPLTLPSHGRS